MSIGLILFFLFIAFVIYVYFYLKQKFGNIGNAFKSIGDSLNPISSVKSGVTDTADKVGGGLKNLF
jgi:TM2 domain-containing membrane protein YozV